MQATERERDFLAKRKKLVRVWPVVGPSLLAVIGCFTAWLFWKNPLLVNPNTVLARMEARSIPGSTMSVMVGLLPVVSLMCLFLVVVMVLFVFMAFANEKKYLAIIERLAALGTPAEDNEEPR